MALSLAPSVSSGTGGNMATSLKDLMRDLGIRVKTAQGSATHKHILSFMERVQTGVFGLGVSLAVTPYLKEATFGELCLSRQGRT